MTLAVGKAGIKTVVAAGSAATLSAVLLGIFLAGYIDFFFPQVIGLFIPSVVVMTFICVSNQMLHRLSVDWLALASALMIWLLVAAVFGEYGGMRAVGFAVFMGLPVFGLALQPGPSLANFATPLAVSSTIAMALWMILLLASGEGQLKPWGLWSPSASINNYGVLLNMMWPLLVLASAESTKRGHKKLFKVLAAIGFACAVGTFSRTAIVTAFLLLAIITLRLNGRLKSAAVFLGVAVASFLFFDELQALLDKFRLTNFTPQLGRHRIWNDAWRAASEHLLVGYGPGGAKTVLASIEAYHAHNDLLNLLLEAGVIAAVLGLIVFSALAFLAARAILTGGLATYAGCSLLAYLASTLAAASLSRPDLTLALVVVAGLCRQQLATVGAQSMSIART